MQPLVRLIVVLILLVPLTPRAEPIDSRQYGFIRNAMTAQDVRARFGPPDHIEASPRRLVSVRRSDGRKAFVEVIEETWVYTGDSQIMSTYIRFEQGRVVGKEKRPVSGVRR